MSNRVVHFEIPCDNPEKTMRFFESVFGWRFQQMGDQQYWMAMTGNDDDPGINGAIMKKNHPDQPVANSINVIDLDKTISDIENHGGKIVVEKMTIPNLGWVAFFKDPDGNIHGIWQVDPKAATSTTPN